MLRQLGSRVVNTFKAYKNDPTKSFDSVSIWIGYIAGVSTFLTCRSYRHNQLLIDMKECRVRRDICEQSLEDYKLAPSMR